MYIAESMFERNIRGRLDTIKKQKKKMIKENFIGVERTCACTTADFRVKDSFIVNALRNCGYTVYTALADIIDNSIEPEVESKNIKVDYDYEKGCITAIYVIDDGNGMSMDVLKEAMCLGSETGKNGEYNLGLYGAGLKTAALSFGQDLEVITKTPDGDLNYARLSITDAIKDKDNGNISLQFNTFDTNSNVYAWFKGKTKSTHGTIVKISALDKLPCKNYNNFIPTLKKKIGIIFNKFIKAKTFKFFVKGTEVPYYDLMDEYRGSENLSVETINIEGHKMTCIFWYVFPYETRLRDNTWTDNNGYVHLDRNSKSQGYYVYRNNRLVGQGLTFGLFKNHTDANGFRCEIFVDGCCDYIFGSTFTKTVSDKEEDGEILQSFKDKLEEVSKKWKQETSRRERKVYDNSEDAKKRKTFLDSVANELNKNNKLAVPRLGINKPRVDGGNKEHKTRGPQANPNPVRERREKWVGFDERPEGKDSEMYFTDIDNITIVINKDHNFYTEFFSKLEEDQQALMLKIIACELGAKKKIEYYVDKDVKSNIDEFTINKSDLVKNVFGH